MKTKMQTTGRADLAVSPELRVVVESAHRELRQLLEDRAEIVKQIATIKKMMAGLASVFGDQVLSEEVAKMLHLRHGGDKLVLIRICRSVLFESGKPPSVEEICEEIKRRSPRIVRKHQDFSHAVEKVLEQFSRSGVARPVTCGSGPTTWQALEDY